MIAAASLSAVAAVACGGGTEPVLAPTPPTVSTSQAPADTVPAGPTVEEVAAGEPVAVDATGAGLVGSELEAFLAIRYEAFWEAFDEARRLPTANPPLDFPALELLAAGDQLQISYRTVSELARQGEAVREPETPAIAGTDADSEHRVSIDRIDGPLAEISACMVNDDVRYEVADGTVVRAEVMTIRSSATMALTDDGWKVVRSRAEQVHDGVGGCWFTGATDYPH